MKHARLLPALGLLGLAALPLAPAQDSPEDGGGHHVWIAHFQPAADRSGALLEEVIAANRISDGAPGLIEYLVMRPVEKEGPIAVVSVWESREALVAYQRAQREEHPDRRVFTPGHVEKSLILEAELASAWRAPAEGAAAPAGDD